MVEWFDDFAVGMRFKSPEKVVTHEEIKRFRPRKILTANVRFGSKADIATQATCVRFTPESGHQFCVFPAAPHHCEAARDATQS